MDTEPHGFDKKQQHIFLYRSLTGHMWILKVKFKLSTKYILLENICKLLKCLEKIAFILGNIDLVHFLLACSAKGKNVFFQTFNELGNRYRNNYYFKISFVF